MMKTIPLVGKKSNGRVALIDDDDFALVSGYRWYAWERPEENGRPNGPYAQARFSVAGRNTGVYMHKLITGWPMTDHADHDGLNNQRYNLRQTDAAKNNHNQRPQVGSSSPFKGVTWNKQARKWQASIKINGRSRYLGLFMSETEAALAYDTAALDAYGEHAYLNLIEGAA